MSFKEILIFAKVFRVFDYFDTGAILTINTHWVA
jgi:hypothetical protein